MDNKAQAMEFWRRRDLPEVQVRYVDGGKTSQQVVLYHIQLGEVGTMTKIFGRRGQVIDQSYHLPNVEGLPAV